MYMLPGIMALAQNADEDDMFEMSLEELMQVEIYSASKKAESSFDAPLSSTVITREEIISSGATTIEEAMRLVPGLIVREESNGNFDVHIRGNDNLPPGSFTFFSENNITLVMVDGRRVYNYANGGTFWETLPISLVDIEQIEVVRGPSSPLYGPNAVSGVINIITRKNNTESLTVAGNVQAGTKNTLIADLHVAKGFADNKLHIGVSGNFEKRDRDQETYYNWGTGAYTPREELIYYPNNIPAFEPEKKFSNPALSKERAGLNAYVNYSPGEKIDIDVAAGFQDSEAQTAYFEINDTQMGTRTSNSSYVNMMADVYGFNAQYSYENGTQDIFKGSPQVSEFDFNKTDFNLDYDWVINNLSIRPGINYQRSVYNDLPYLEAGRPGGYFNAERELTNLAYFIKFDYKVLDEKLRLIAALRSDNYNVPDDSYFTYQFIGSYKINENNLIRLVYSKSNRGPFMIDSYTNFNVVALGNTGVRFLGNESLNLPTMNMIDLGYRANISEKVLVDFEFFRTNMSDISTFEPVSFETDPQGTAVLNFAYLNNDLKVRQTGASFMVNWAPVRALKFRFFGTVQHTELEDYDMKISPPGIDPSTGTFKLTTYERQNTDHTRTPSFYGGATANWRPLDRLSVFAHVYYMGEQTYRHEAASYNEEIGSTTIDPRTIFNLKIGYEVINGVNLFVNGRNIFNSEQDEFGFTDQIGGLYLAGLNFNF